MSVYTPTPSRLVPTTIPDDGDDVDASSVGVPFGSAFDAIEYLSLKTEGNRLVSPGLSPVWHTQTTYAAAYNAGAFWPAVAGATTDISSPAGQARISLTRFTAGAQQYGVRIGISHGLIHGMTLSSVVMRFAGPAAHAVGPTLPSVMPKLCIVRYDADDTISSLLAAGHVSDSSAGGVAYAAVHDVTLTPDQNQVIDLENYTYAAIVWSEGGGLAGGLIYSLKMVHS